jgi:TetR/AcrR family transcriptional regulator, cholesterol catabolism regulator
MPAVKTTGPTAAANGTAETEPGSAAQRERRKRILDATLALASKGGYEAVQMREVAERADVALGTLCRYFPSKIHLLVSALVRDFEQAKEKLSRRPIPGDTPAERIIYVLNRVTRNMQREPLLTEAMTRAFMFADPSAASEVNTVAALTEQLLTDAMHAGRRAGHRPRDRRRLAVEPGGVGDAPGLGERRHHPARARGAAAPQVAGRLGSGPPYQFSISHREIDSDGGITSSPDRIASRRLSLPYQRASAISSPSTVISVPVASARKPSIRLCGIGHGWLPA